MTDTIYVIGHKNPDMDSIASAIAFANLKKMKGQGHFTPARAGKIDDETKFVLEKFNIPTPEELMSAKGKTIVLVDHCEKCQLVEGGEEADIIEIIDHHKIGDVQTAKPIRYHAEPVGSSSTIVGNYYFEHKIEVPKEIAGILLSAIISDTDMFKSPTTTEHDKEVGQKLSKIAGIDIEKHGTEMFKAKMNVEKKTIEEISNMDFKEFELPGGVKLACNQVKLMELGPFLKKRKKELVDYMNKANKEKKYDLFINIITDVIKEGSEMVAVGRRIDLFEKAFNVKLKEDSVYIPGIMSRKKQVIPPLTLAK